ncbi:lipoyltransferase 2, mitochondrial [Seminavis robusta]|uniref:lipoyl(octanoyl) transferase n=1 Tax=Seminavis robusta TaxID=568900 RepID=A0A9N8H6F8_9STRA|nr:lipoyltransferase 2, mitochondrial [Seminavis robusta]|eukprot:Sro43_g026000.1 lipoyltransferase 2, mitochondrial (316) ;mRNA; f:29363-30453
MKRPLTRVLSSLHRHDYKANINRHHQYIDYCRGWAWQQVLLTQRLAARKLQENETTAHDIDSILLLEHAPVYTLGRGASEDHLLFLNNDNDDYNKNNSHDVHRLSRKYRGADSPRLVMNDRKSLEEMLQHQTPQDAVSTLASLSTPVLAPNGVPIYRVDRGGEVTFHGPSQLVVYPIFDLKQEPFKADLHWFLRQVEEVVIQTLQHYEIEGGRDEINSGVWVGQNKIAAIGVSATSWISSHGFSLNVSPNLDYFDTSLILPCGIEGRGVTSIERELLQQQNRVAPTVVGVADVALQKIGSVFGIEVGQSSPIDYY